MMKNLEPLMPSCLFPLPSRAHLGAQEMFGYPERTWPACHALTFLQTWSSRHRTEFSGSWKEHTYSTHTVASPTGGGILIPSPPVSGSLSISNLHSLLQFSFSLITFPFILSSLDVPLKAGR
ncbi:hypothetical protein mRhiFer1_008686 [Rhinolophus ferrumequinum]|uniref:Uncharacterized protein n=1 Tax=Rhinolophus ferrumequinum TaxID=59479 RepID=A0A7J7TRB8_RHIFE|nr:hypothetical protein mRhiFer1_008686 [Rhinolophus ferrumequinum]